MKTLREQQLAELRHANAAKHTAGSNFSRLMLRRYEAATRKDAVTMDDRCVAALMRFALAEARQKELADTYNTAPAKRR